MTYRWRWQATSKSKTDLHAMMQKATLQHAPFRKAGISKSIHHKKKKKSREPQACTLPLIHSYLQRQERVKDQVANPF